MSEPGAGPATEGTSPAPALFEVDRVSRAYRHHDRETRALDDVSLTLHRGERLGIVGESGSGKSTLVRIMAALETPSSGEVRFEGRSLTGVKERRLGFLRSAVQLVLQDPRSSLDPRMRVADIIAEPLRSRLLSDRDDVPRDHGARVAEVLQQVGLPGEAARRYPHEFSGGQRQRIAIARALAPRPQVLIADEAVSALDVSVRAQVLNLLAELVAENSLTLVFVSHDLMVVRHLCDRVQVMQAGRIVEAGPTAQVYADPASECTRDLLAAVPRLPEP